jgi:hypothetical protein
VDFIASCSDLFLGPGFRALFAVEDVGACHVVLARAHQRELDLVLDVFNMEGAAARLAAHERVDDVLGQVRDHRADAGRGGALRAVDGQERLGHRH